MDLIIMYKLSNVSSACEIGYTIVKAHVDHCAII